MSTIVRKSNLEILRIICIFGIISMHTFGQLLNTCNGINLIYGVLINSIFNMGVSCFMLISGYFGVRFSAKKIIELELMILFYGLLGQAITFVISGQIDVKGVFKSVFPIATCKYWYMSVYIIIIFTSKYIDVLIEHMDRKKFKILIFTLLLFFYIMPSFTYYEIMHDSGKGIANMFIVYLTGKYIRKYHDGKMNTSRLMATGLIIIGCSFTFNYVLSVIIKGGEGMFAPFARDNSITIYLGSILFFLAFKNMQDIKSVIINKFASSVFAIYLFEGTVRQIINNFYDISTWGGDWYLFSIITLYAVVIMVAIFIIDSLKKIIFRTLENKLMNFLLVFFGRLRIGFVQLPFVKLIQEKI